MNMPISPSEKQAVLEKRQHLFALWQNSDPAPETPSMPAPRPQYRPVQAAPAKGQSEEIQELIQKFTNPNTDRWALF